MNNKNKLDLTVLLILRLQFPSTKYKSLAKQGHDENSKEKLEKRGERGVRVQSDFSSPLLQVNSPFPKPTKSLKNILNNNIQIWLIKENIYKKKKKSPNITRKVVFFSWIFHAPDLKASENKLHQVLEFQAKEDSRMSAVQVQQF